MKTLNTKQCLTLVGLLATGMVLSSVAVAGKDKGNNDANPYALAVTALQDITGNTDVYLDVSVVESGFSAPGKAKHIQMKSFDLEDEVRWAKNLKNVALSDGSVQLAYDDMLRHQPVQAQIQVQNDETRNTEVLKTKSNVLLRPDLKVTPATDAYQALVGEIISVVINVEELNGDVGADSTVSIVDGMLPLDFADGVRVEPMTGSTVIFALSFDEPGEYDLSAIAGDVNPGDYDVSNNAADFTVTVTEPEAEMATVPYYMYYNRSWSNYHYEYQTYYGSHFYNNDYHWESLSNSL